MDHPGLRKTKRKPRIVEWEDSVRRFEWLDLRSTVCEGVESERRQAPFTESVFPSLEFNSPRCEVGVCCGWSCTRVEVGRHGKAKPSAVWWSNAETAETRREGREIEFPSVGERGKAIDQNGRL